MSNKLTLSIKEQVVAEAKLYAKEQGKSLSSLVEEYLKSLSANRRGSKHMELSEIIKDLKGSIKAPHDDKSYKELLEDALIEKFLNDE